MEVIPIPCPHFQITITQRSKGQSAVAGAAYQSGEKLFSEYDQKTKNYSGKRGILYTEIMLPSHAPPEYANRETLWNSVEAAEKQWNAQLARRLVLALPKEVPLEQYPKVVSDRAYYYRWVSTLQQSRPQGQEKIAVETGTARNKTGKTHIKTSFLMTARNVSSITKKKKITE